MKAYICRVATKDDVARKWDDLIKEHPDDVNWKVWKAETISNLSTGKTIPYFGFLDNEIICEAYAAPDHNPAHGSGSMAEEGTVYLSAFRATPQYRGKGYFSELISFMLNDLQQRGYKRAILGVEPEETQNMMMYRHWGFDKKIYSGTCTYPDGTVIEVDYYEKCLDEVEKNDK